MPTNLYGPGDNFHPTESHVIPGLMRRIHEAKVRGDETVKVWGSGRPRREFLHVDDLADALVHLLRVWSGETAINVGTGQDLPIAELAQIIANVVGFEGELVFDPSMPDGTPRKLLDTRRLQALGWQPRIDLHAGLRETYDWFVQSGNVIQSAT